MYLSEKATALASELMGHIIPLRRGVELSVRTAALPACIAQGAHQTLNLWHVGVLETCKMLPRILQRCLMPCKHTQSHILYLNTANVSLCTSLSRRH